MDVKEIKYLYHMFFERKKIKFKLIQETPRFSKDIFNIHLHNKQISNNKFITCKRLIRIKFKQSFTFNVLNRFINLIDVLYKLLKKHLDLVNQK